MAVIGIDVSSAGESEIDWHAVAGARIGFTYIKATEGMQTDPGASARVAFFREHWPRAGAVGVARGAYHFFHPGEDGAAQANVFLEIAHSVASAELPPMVDVENEKGQAQVDRATFVARLSACLATIENALGVRPMIYTNTPYWNAHLDGSFGAYPLWIANYGANTRGVPPAPPTPRDFLLPVGWQDYTIWQFSQYGNVPGIGSGRVDLDYFPGTRADLLNLGASRKPVAVTVNSSVVPNADGFLSPEGRSFAWVRPVAGAIGATIVDVGADQVTLQRGATDVPVALQVSEGKGFVHLSDLDALPGVAVVFDSSSQTVEITAG